MALLDEQLKIIAERKRKMKISSTIVYGFLSLVLIIVAIRAVVLIYFPYSWLAKHFFNW